MKNLLIMLTFAITLTHSYAYVDKQDISLYQVAKSDIGLKQITMEFEIVDTDETNVFIYVPTFRSKHFEAIAKTEKLLKSSIYNDQKGLKLEKGYRNFDEVVAKLKEFETLYPQTVNLEKYGESALTNQLYYLKVSHNVHIDNKKPKLLITAATHGDELITTESLLRFLENFLGSQGIERHQEILNNYQLYFIPVVNPDGFMRQRRYTADGTDPNRSYPYPLKPNIEPVKCIAEEIAFFHSQNFVGSIDFHASGEMIMYPWAYTYDSPIAGDLAKFESIGKKMSVKNGYKIGQISKIIYIAPASSVDYFYWKNGTISYGIELARSKAPRAKKIPEIVNEASTILYSFILSF